jgi:hypothetical protein
MIIQALEPVNEGLSDDKALSLPVLGPRAL